MTQIGLLHNFIVRNQIFTIREAFRCLRILIKFYLMVVLLEVVVGDEVPVELEVQHKVLAPDVPGHGEVLRVHTCTRVQYSTVYSTREHVYSVHKPVITCTWLPSSPSSLVLASSRLWRPW